MYGDLAMAFLKHLRNQDLWTEHTTQSLPSVKPEAEKHRNDPKKTHIHEATHLCVQTNGGPCQGDHHMKAMRWALLGFDGSEEQTERKNKIISLLFPGGVPGPGQPAALETRASHLSGHSAAPGRQGRAAGLPSGASCLWGGEGFCKSCYK